MVKSLSDITAKPISELTDDEIEYLLSKSRRLVGKIPGAMNLFDIPGTSFGYAHLVEREQLRRRIVAADPGISGVELHFAIVKAQEEVHRNNPRYSEYQKVLMNRTKGTSIEFTKEELEHIIDHFGNANDPFVVGLVEKARKQIERRSK